MESSAENNFLRKKYTTSIAFAVGILLFLLPFVEVRCNNMVVAENTGLGLAIGTDFSASDDIKAMQDSFGGGQRNERGEERNIARASGKVYVFALAALLLGVAGLLLSFTAIPNTIANTVIAVLAGLCLIGLMFQVKSDLSSKLETGEDSSYLFRVKFTLFYFLSLAGFLAAAFFSFKRGQLEAMDGVPPNAPQLDIANPGDQSEFPKAASDSELG